MAFKMKGYPQHSGVGGVQKEKELKAEIKSMAKDKPKTTKTEKPAQTYEEWAKTSPGTARWVSKDEYEDMVRTTRSNIENYPGDSKAFKKKKCGPYKKKGPCWEGYEMIGMKNKGGRKVPNCVPKKK